MCGIVGIFNLDRAPIDPYLLKRMTSIISHRGPDDEGHVLLTTNHIDKNPRSVEFVDLEEIKNRDLSGFNIGLGFRRLSIIDLSSAGHQPLSNEDDSIWIVFNGEFYNYFEFINDLRSKGHVFKSRTDTEVIIHLYEEYGIDKTLEKMNGMFAFCLCDVRKRCLLLVRDRAGIKPLYFYRSKNKLVFASEIKAILENPDVPRYFDSSKIDELFHNKCVNAPNTVFYDIKKVIPGTYWNISFDKVEPKESTYWSLFNYLQDGLKPSIEDYHKYLIESISYRLRSDVPLGVFLSGGLDSSTICAIIRQKIKKELKTFSIGFGSYSTLDESWASKLVADFLGTKHYNIQFKLEVFDVLPKIVWHCEEPIADPALLPTYYLSKFTRNHVTVALSGEGSDETNYGYEGYRLGKLGRLLIGVPRYLQRKILSALTFLPENKRIRRVKSFMDHPISNHDHEQFIPEPIYKGFLNCQSNLSLNVRGYWWKEHFNAKSIFDVKPLIDFHSWLQDDLLLKVDKMSMANSLEVRVPYLDPNLVTIAFNVDFSHKISLISTKCILRKIAKIYLPIAITKRKQHGFLVPLYHIFQDDLFSKPHKKSHLREFLEPLSDFIDIDKMLKALAPKDFLTWNATVQLWLLTMIGLCVNQFRLNIK